MRLKFFSACSANAKKYLAYTQCKLKFIPFFKISANDAEHTLKNVKRTLIIRLILFSVCSAFAKNTKWQISSPNKNKNNFFRHSPSHLTIRVCFMLKISHPTWSCLGPFKFLYDKLCTDIFVSTFCTVCGSRNFCLLY